MPSGRPRDISGLAPVTAVAAILASLVGGARARASCAEEATLSVGVTVRRCEDGALRWSVVSADLAASDVAVRVSRSAERGVSVDAWRAGVPGAVALVQGGPFAFPDYEPLGLTIGEGEAWPGTRDDGELAVLALDESGAGLVAAPEASVTAESWIRSAVSGPAIVRAGVAVAACEGDACERMPRTAAGLGADGRQLVIVVVEGWTSMSTGVSDPELGVLAQEAGAYDAIRIGAGATSLLSTAGGVGAIASSDGAPRATAAFLAIVDRGSGATGDLVGVVERGSDTMPLTAAQIRVETTDGRTIAMGGTLTTGAYFRFVLPERTYVVRATLAGYRDVCRVCSVERGRETWCSVFMESGSGAASCSAPPRGVDAGAFPLFDGGADAGTAGDGGLDARGIGGGCAISGSRPSAGAWAVAVLALMLASRRRSMLASRRCSMLASRRCSMVARRWSA